MEHKLRGNWTCFYEWNFINTEMLAVDISTDGYVYYPYLLVLMTSAFRTKRNLFTLQPFHFMLKHLENLWTIECKERRKTKETRKHTHAAQMWVITDELFVKHQLTIFQWPCTSSCFLCSSLPLWILMKFETQSNGKVNLAAHLILSLVKIGNVTIVK